MKGIGTLVSSSSLSSLLGFALLPAIKVEQCAIRTLPRKFLSADVHVRRFGSIKAVGMFEELILDDGKDTNRKANDDRNFDPLPHLIYFLSVGMPAGHDLLLAGDARTDLFNGFSLHFFFGSKAGNCLGGAALDGSPSEKARPKRDGGSERHGVGMVVCVWGACV